MSEEYDRLVVDVATNCPGVIPGTFEAELILVLRDFLQQTSAWKQDFEMPVKSDRTCYVIQPLRGTAIHLLFNVFNSTDPDKKPIAPAGWRMNRPGQIEFSIAPSADALWVATVSLYPVAASQGSASSCAGTVPGSILNEYYDTILHGVLSRLQGQLMKGYTNPQLALMHQKLYREGRSTAKADIARSHVWGTQQWRYPAGTTAYSNQRSA